MSTGSVQYTIHRLERKIPVECEGKCVYFWSGLYKREWMMWCGLTTYSCMYALLITALKQTRTKRDYCTMVGWLVWAGARWGEAYISKHFVNDWIEYMLRVVFTSLETMEKYVGWKTLISTKLYVVLWKHQRQQEKLCFCMWMLTQLFIGFLYERKTGKNQWALK